MNKRIGFSFFIGLLTSAAAFYLCFRSIPVSETLRYVSSINYLWMLPAAAMVLISFWLRVIRWQVILGDAHKIRFWQAFHPLMIGFMVNCILPGRVGELARPAILKKKENIAFSTGLSSVAAERLFDVILLIVLCIIVLLTVHIDPDLDISFGRYTLNRATLITLGSGMIKLVLAVSAATVFISVKGTRDLIQRAIMALPRLCFFTTGSFRKAVRDNVCTPLITGLTNAISVFSMVKNPKKLWMCGLLSLGIWGTSAVSYYIMALGCPGFRLSFLELSAVMIIICVFIALPSVPGYWGLWEAGGIFAMTLFGAASESAAGFTLVNHVIQMVPVIIVGLISAVVTSVKLSQISYSVEEPS